MFLDRELNLGTWLQSLHIETEVHPAYKIIEPMKQFLILKEKQNFQIGRTGRDFKAMAYRKLSLYIKMRCDQL